MLSYAPAVFAVDKFYQVVVYTEVQSLVAIRVGNENLRIVSRDYLMEKIF